jgi:DNA-binding IclR family transcriptional regulator
MELLFRLAGRERGTSLQQLAREVGCSKSTAHRLLATLERMAVVERDGISRHYRLGRRAGELAREAQGRADLRQVAVPYMQALRETTDETVTLHLLEGDSYLVVAQVESHHEIRRIHPLGIRVPMLLGATAKAILAFLPWDEARQILARNATPAQRGPGEQELRDIRELGYAFSMGERIPGGSAVAAPIFDHQGRVCAALAISGPTFRLTPARATRFVTPLLQAARRISEAIGYSGSRG